MIKVFKKAANKIIRMLKRTTEYRGKNILQKIQLCIHKFYKRIICDYTFFESIKKDLDKIPESNGCRYYRKYEISIGIICDEFLYNSFKDIADFKYITPINFKEYINNIEFLLVVTTWRGLNNEWRIMGTHNSPANKSIYEIINYCKEIKKPVVFYSKEDPPNYEHFLPLAKHCDIIFTSACEMVEKYKQDCNNNNVYTMKFGINPIYHNPIGCRITKRKKEVIFSGSWVKKYPQRIKEQNIIFKGILKAGYKLKIIDRNFTLDNLGFLFPFRYYKYISPAIPHNYLQKVHKLFDWAVNVNSVNDSKTMFANRIYELQATGNLILSNYSTGVEAQFEEIKLVNNENEVVQALKAYDDKEIYQHQMASVRRVMTGETTFDRVYEMLQLLDVKVRESKRRIIVVVNQITEKISSAYNSQTYPYKILVERKNLSENMFLEYDMITMWEKDRVYGIYYLEDMINAFKYTQCYYITKNKYTENNSITLGVEHNYTNFINDVFATIFWNSVFKFNEIINYFKIKKDIKLENGYSIDYLNYSVEEQELNKSLRLLND